MLNGLAVGDLEYQLCQLKQASSSASVRETLSDILTKSRGAVERVRQRLELCTDPASLDKLWKETERLVEAEVGRAANSYRELRADPAMKNVLDDEESEDEEWTIDKKFCIDTHRLMPVLFCFEIEDFLRDIALNLK